MTERADYLPYLETLRRIPDGVVLSMATREFQLNEGFSCVCGWALRDAIFRETDAEPTLVDIPVFTRACANRFGGSVDAWIDIYLDVVGEYAPLVETAFTERVVEAVEASA